MSLKCSTGPGSQLEPAKTGFAVSHRVLSALLSSQHGCLIPHCKALLLPISAVPSLATSTQLSGRQEKQEFETYLQKLKQGLREMAQL